MLRACKMFDFVEAEKVSNFLIMGPESSQKFLSIFFRLKLLNS